MLIAVGVIAISAGVIGIIFGLSRFDVLRGNVLNVSKAEAGVQRILLDPADGYGVTSVTDVVCNNGDDPEIKKLKREIGTLRKERSANVVDLPNPLVRKA